MEKRYSCTETAQFIRAALKKHYPAVTFSVRSKMYSGGSSIDVRYTDGPATKDVESVVKAFQGASFDGMTDLRSYVHHSWNGEPVSFGANYVFVDHKWTEPQREAILSEIKADTGQVLTYLDYDYWRVFSEYATAFARRSFPVPLVTNAPKVLRIA